MRLVCWGGAFANAPHTCAQVSTLIQFLPGFDTIMLFACSPTPQTLDIRNNTFGHSHLVQLFYFELGAEMKRVYSRCTKGKGRQCTQHCCQHSAGQGQRGLCAKGCHGL